MFNTELINILTFNAGYNTSIVLLGTTLLGVSSGAIGVFTLLRKRALIGDALAHSTLPGLAAAFILANYLGLAERSQLLLLAGATLSGVLGVLTVQALTRFTRLDHDAAIGTVLSCFFGGGIVLLSIIQSLESAKAGGLHHYIFGQTAALTMFDTNLLAGTACLLLLSCFLLTKEFRIVCFDENFALSDGWPVSLIDFLIMALVVIVTVIGLQSVGLLLIVALLIIPAASARFWTNSLNKMLVISPIIGGLSGYFGSAISALHPKMPAGAVIVTVSGFLFLLSFLFAPVRGLVSSHLRQLKVRTRISVDHFLRDLVESSEKNGEDIESIVANRTNVALFDGWRDHQISFFLFEQRLCGLISKNHFLTEKGVLLAKSKVRNHRLWEEYLITFASVNSSHVDYSADLVEHVLSKEIVAELEQSLARKEADLPKSVHPIQ